MKIRVRLYWDGILNDLHCLKGDADGEKDSLKDGFFFVKSDKIKNSEA